MKRLKEEDIGNSYSSIAPSSEYLYIESIKEVLEDLINSWEKRKEQAKSPKIELVIDKRIIELKLAFEVVLR